MAEKLKATTVLSNTFDALHNNIDPKNGILDKCKSDFKRKGWFRELKKCPYARPRRITEGNDTRSYLRNLEENGLVDETNLSVIRIALEKYSPETLSVIEPSCNKPVEEDPVANYLKKVTPPQLSDNKQKKKKKCTKSKKRRSALSEETEGNTTQVQNTLDRPHHTSCLRMHVQVTHRQYMHYVQQAVHVHEEHQKKRQFEKFNQAYSIMKETLNENLGFTVEFAELTLLDAFWRDYHNGMLGNVLKSLLVQKLANSTIGETDIQLYVDEKQYKQGRLRLLQNLTG